MYALFFVDNASAVDEPDTGPWHRHCASRLPLVVLGAFLLRRHMTATTAYFLPLIYLGWMSFVFYDMVEATRGAG